MSSLSASDPLVAVSVQDLWVQYRTTSEKTPTLKSTLAARRRRKLRLIEAIRGVSLDVPRGTVLGIVGANGAGKSTLLRTIAGILPPNKGRVEVRGEVSTLLALGVGFNKTLSGRENIVLGSLAAGLEPDEISARFDDVVAFADLDEFIDLPMTAYSSGMYARLAFSVAVHMDPDILLIDEALSTGDAAFRRKSTDRMLKLCEEASTILLVSHSLGTIQELAHQCLWLDKGTVMGHGDPETILDEYTAFMDRRAAAQAG